MANRGELFDRLKCLSPAQFEEVLFRLEIEPWIIPGAFAEQSVRAKAVIQRLEQEQEGLVRLEKTLAEPAISILGEQYIGYEIEAQVKRIISEYTQQPFEGREEEKRRLDEFVNNNSSGVFLVTAAAGFGKSALLSHWQQTRQEDYFIAYHCFSYRYEKTRLVSEAYRHLLKQLYLYYNIRNGQFPNDENGMRDILVGMLREPVSSEGKRLVIVLDGLDEASKTFEPFFTLLPDGVFVIASARAEEGDKPEYLRNWTDNAESLCLKRLSREAIAKWLGQIKELAAYSEDNQFVTSLDETTGGFPLYLRFLIDDLRQAVTKNQDVQAVLRNSPGGFKAYVKEQFRQLAKVEEIKRQRKVQELFALLSVALGALSEDDIQELTSLSAWDLADLPWQATRWFSIQMGVYSFAHPLLADEFQGVLGRQADSAQGKLIEYCAKWQEHHSAYALRHYAEHLGKAKRWEKLYEIALNRDFASTQRQQLPDEPDLSLKTVRTALLGAAEEDNAEKMAEFLLVHAHRLGQTNAQESPLEALRSGSLERALKLAEHYEIERCVLWYLLLAWELKDEGKLDVARETLERLQQKDLPRFPINGATRWQGEYAAYLLAYIFEVSQETCMALAQKFFPYNTCCLLGDFLIEHGNVTAALKIAEEIILELKQVFPLPNILKAQIEKGNSQETTTVFAQALEITRKTFPSWCWGWWMGQIAKAQIAVGHKEEARATFTEAIETAHKIENPKTRTSTLIEIADSQADVELFSDARETLRRIVVQGNLEDLWVDLAKVQEKIGDKKQAQISYSSFQQIDPSIEDKSKARGSDLPLLRLLEQQKLIRTVTQQAETGQFDDALKTVSTLKQQSQQEDALLKIAEVYIHNKDFNQAWKIVNRLYDSVKKLKIRQSIATRQVQAGQAKEARNTLAIGIQTFFDYELSYQQAFALIDVAEVMIVAGYKEKIIDIIRETYEIAKAISNLKDRVNVLAVLGEVSAKADQRKKAKDIFTEAIDFVQQIEKQNLPNDVYFFIVGLFTKIGVAQARAGEFYAALETVQMIKFTEGKVLVLKMLAQSHPETEQREKLDIALTTAYKDAFSSFKWGFDHPANTLSSIAVARMELGEREAALAIFAKACELVKEEKVQKFKINPDSLLSTVAVAQAEAREFDTALQNAHQIEDKWEQVKALSEIALFQWKKGDKERLSKTLDATLNAKEQITDEQKRIGALWLIAQMQAMAGKVEQALHTAEQFLTNRNQLLCHIATIFAQVKDKDNFKKLLIPCAYSFDTAYKMCGCLAYLYPEKAESVAEAVKKFT